MWTHPVPSKGTAGPAIFAAKALAQDLRRLGYKRVVLRSDSEPAILAVRTEGTAMWDGEVVPEHAVRDEKQSNGEIERAVQTMAGLARTLKDALETQSGTRLDARHPVCSWLIEYVGVLHNLFHRGAPNDGLTPY